MAYTDQQKKAHIREIQGMLNGISYFNPDIPHIIPDGIFGDKTREAVRAFQKSYGLRQTGEVNYAVWVKIVEVFRALTGTEPEPLAVFPAQSDAVVLPGDSGFLVSLIQLILHELSECSCDIPNCHMTGTFGDETLRSLQMFQHLCGLPVTGGVCCKTWNMLVQAVHSLLI